MLNFFKRKKDWRDDDYIFLDELKQKRNPDYFEAKFKEAEKKEVKNIVEESGDKSKVRQRLEKLQDKPSKPVFMGELKPKEVEEEKDVEECSEKPFLKEVERKLKRLENLRLKMKNNPGSYLSLFYDLKKAEKEFLSELKKAEEAMVDFPGHIKMRIDKEKSSIKTI